MNLRRSALCATLAALAAGAATGQPAEGFLPLFDGTLRGWTVENTTLDNFTIADGVLTVEGTRGWLKSERQYSNFELRIEFRMLTEDADSGIFVRTVADALFGPGWPSNGYQLQMLNPHRDTQFPVLGSLFRHGTPAGQTTFDPAVARHAFTGLDEWQTLEIAVVGSQLTAHLNGVLLTQAANIANPTGFVGIQGESGALEFRKVEIRER